MTPDEVSKKSLKVLDAKLLMLAQQAAFSVNLLLAALSASV